MDVGRGDAQRLRAWIAVLARQVDVAHAHVDRVSRSHDAGEETYSGVMFIDDQNYSKQFFAIAYDFAL